MPTLTKAFVLPGLLPADVLAKPQVKNVQNRRTVHLYIPPPPLLGNPDSSGGKNEAQNPDVPNATDADVYPSPSRSRVSRLSSLGTHRRKDVRFTPKGQPNPTYHPPSPPTSDLPIPGQDSDLHFHIDAQDVRRKHPATKALFEKVFSNISFQSFVLIHSGLQLLAPGRLLCLPPRYPRARELWCCF